MLKVGGTPHTKPDKHWFELRQVLVAGSAWHTPLVQVPEAQYEPKVQVVPTGAVAQVPYPVESNWHWQKPDPQLELMQH